MQGAFSADRATTKSNIDAFIPFMQHIAMNGLVSTSMGGTLFDGFRIRVAERPHEQIREHVREIIVSGQLAPGERLPSTQRLAQLFGTHPATVHKALLPIVQEGLLVRINGKGTFVRKREERLTCVGMYFEEDVLAKHASDFQRAVYLAAKDELNRLGVRLQVWVDPRPKAEQTGLWSELAVAAERREIQGLIVPAIVEWANFQWLRKLPVPSAFATSANIPNRISYANRQLAQLSLHALVEQGCRSVGLVMPVSTTDDLNPDGSGNLWMDFFSEFTELAADLGLRTKNEWMRVPAAALHLHHNETQEQYGYAEVLALWSQPERPEGLLAFPDTTSRGVILGLLEKRVRVPDELKLVLSKNEGTPLLCPMPATLVTLSERDHAKALIELVQKQFRGESCEPITVGFTLSVQN